MGALRRGIKIAETIRSVVKDPNPANKAASIVGAATAAAGHPLLAPVAAAGAKKVVEYAQRPEVQAKAREIGQRAATGAASAAGAAARGVQRGATNGLKKLQSFREGHGK